MKILSTPQYYPQYNTQPTVPTLRLGSQLPCDTVCFKGTSAQEKYPNYGKLPSRLDGYKFPEIKYIWNESPDFANRILYDEIVEEDGEVIPRFIDYAVRSMIKLHYESPQFVEKLIKETKLDENGKETYRFNEYDMKELVNSYKRAPHFTDELVSYKITNSDGKKDERFSAMDIAMLVDMYTYNKTHHRDDDNRFLRGLLEETSKTENGYHDYLWDFEDITTIYSSLKYAKNRDILRTKDYAPDAKKVLVRIKDIKDIDKLAETIELVKEQTKNIDNPASFAEILGRYNNNKSDDLNDYISNIDFKELKNMAPRMKDFSGTEMIKFIDYHYKSGESEFCEDNLKLTKDFTKFLAANYVNAEDMEDILTIFPITDRNVGNMPEGWLDNTADDEKDVAKGKIYNICTSFVKNRDEKGFTSALSKTLGKKASLEELDTGVVGIGYRVSVEGSPDIVIKAFHKHPALESPSHGRGIETQMGLFLNDNSDEYVHMYFGRVCGENDKDGFLVTQFLDDDIIPIEGHRNPKYNITNSDANGDHNIINGKIIDFGSVDIEYTDGSEVKTNIFAKKRV